MSKEQYMAAHEQLIAEYLDLHPDATDSEAYEKTADAAYDLMRERIADVADYQRMMMKERFNG